MPEIQGPRAWPLRRFRRIWESRRDLSRGRVSEVAAFRIDQGPQTNMVRSRQVRAALISNYALVRLEPFQAVQAHYYDCKGRFGNSATIGYTGVGALLARL